MKNFIERKLVKNVSGGLEDIEAVFINGPRQSGKSAFAENFGNNYQSVYYITYDDVSVRYSEINSPGQTFASIEEGLIILDEIQYVPNSFLSIKNKIDDIRRKKQKVKFLLTGSADIMLLPKLTNALVGRMYCQTMLPFSAAEILNAAGTFIDKMFKGGVDITKRYSKVDIAKIISKATFPKLSLEIKNKAQWCGNYISALIERDIRALSDIDKIEILTQLLFILANRVGNLINDADIAIAVKLSQPTVKRHRALLNGVFLTFLLNPWFKKLEKRFIKTPKIYFHDAMLLCRILGFAPDEIEKQRPEIFGFILENFVATELNKQLALMNEAKLYFFRTSDQKEIDFLVEKQNGDLIAIEVKAANTVFPIDFKHIKFLQESLPENFIKGIVLYRGDKALKFGDNLYALPISALWEL
ncbi:MAG: ATP-binding protein [Elusimicrobiota bacterium]|nr:ATP-binding protein [Elusimicrobiota bacterium]